MLSISPSVFLHSQYSLCRLFLSWSISTSPLYNSKPHTDVVLLSQLPQCVNHLLPNAPTHIRDRCRESCERRRVPTHAGHRRLVAGRRRSQRDGKRHPPERTGSIRKGDGSGQLDRPAPLTNPPPTKPPTAKNGALFRLFSRFSFFGAPKNGVSTSSNAV